MGTRAPAVGGSPHQSHSLAIITRDSPRNMLNPGQLDYVDSPSESTMFVIMEVAAIPTSVLQTRSSRYG